MFNRDICEICVWILYVEIGMENQIFLLLLSH